MILNDSVSSQNILDKFITQQDSSINRLDSLRNLFSGSYSDTIVNRVKLKKISEYSWNYYYGEIDILDGKVIGNQPPALLTLNDCNPCYLYNFRDDGTLYDEGIYKTDCPLGLRIQYFSTRRIATTTNYTPDTSGNSCSVLDGETSYYNYNGDKILSEFWSYDELLRIIPYNLSITGDVKFLVDNKLLLINDTIKVDNFRKINLQPDTNQNAELKNGFSVWIRVWQEKKNSRISPYYNLKSFNDSNLIAELNHENFNLKQGMHMLITLMCKKRNEFIESHNIVFYKEQHDKD